MGSLIKSLALLALLFTLSLAVFADTSNDAATQAKEEVKPSEATDAIEPQQSRGCRYGCCGAYAYGQCAACCSRPQAAEAKAEANDVVVEPQGNDVVVEPQDNDVVVEPQQIRRCRYGCCGRYPYPRCSVCCSAAQAAESKIAEVSAAQAAETKVVEPQQGRCRYGCCGRYPYPRCSVCCTKKMANTEEEAKP